jgi:hypothetical protein
MAPTLAITAAAFVLVLSTPSAAIKGRRIVSGSYCINDQNQRVSCGINSAAVIGPIIGGVGPLRAPVILLL